MPPPATARPIPAVTVYNSSIALIRDIREFALPAGESDLQFIDIAATVNPATVHFRSLTDPACQRPRAELRVRPARAGEAAPQVRRPRRDPHSRALRERHDEGGSRNGPARQLQQRPDWKIGNEDVTGLHQDHLRFPELPSNLYSRPTLVWKLLNRGGPRHRVEALYLAGGLSWQSDYVLTVGRDDKTADSDGWITLTNSSGTAFRDAKLQLMPRNQPRQSRRPQAGDGG